jgi:hypothetical protein
MANSYCLPSDGDYYFSGRLFAEAWYAATPDRKEAALSHATKIIDALSFRGLKAETLQPLSWPRILEQGSDPITPQVIYDACCEIALALLTGINPENEFRNVNKTSQGYGALRHTKDTTMVDPHFVHGVPSITAWNYLRPYLTDITCGIMFQGT